MKRKRGPAPREKHRKVKRKDEGENESESEGGNALLEGESEEFGGFSSDGDRMDADQPKSGNEVRQNGQADGTRKGGKKAAPMQEDLLDLFYRSSSFQSNLFKLQVDELLPEVRVKYEKMEKVESILHRLRVALLEFPSCEEQLVSMTRGCAD
jgi:U3 small nucleolar RNA-associated protein 22